MNEELPITLKLSPTRMRWLEELAAFRQQPIEQIVSDLVHNKTLDFQMDYYPESHPDQTPFEAKITRQQGE